jgi:hypothetical protein
MTEYDSAKERFDRIRKALDRWVIDEFSKIMLMRDLETLEFHFNQEEHSNGGIYLD